MSEVSEAAKAVAAAWNDAGRNPTFHRQWKLQLKRDWPTLAIAVEQLAKELKNNE